MFASKIFPVACFLASLLIPSAALGVTSSSSSKELLDNDTRNILWVTTRAAMRAESDLQVRRIKGLLGEKKITSESFFAEAKKIRSDLGQ